MRGDGATLQFNIDGQRQIVNTDAITAPAIPIATRKSRAGKSVEDYLMQPDLCGE